MKSLISEYGMLILQVVGAAFFLTIFWQLFGNNFINILLQSINSIIGG